jgi:hypothetical protein
MATFLPKVSLAEISVPSERLVYEALQGLSDEYWVLHSYPWLRPDRSLSSEPIREGEADFVILHPRKGLLVLEVKGGTPRLEGRVWFRGEKEMKNPFEQARRNRYALLDAIEERTRRRVTRTMLTHGDLVVFPHSLFSGPLPVDAEPRMVVDQHGLEQLPHLVESAYQAWNKGAPGMSQESFRVLIDALLPKLRLVRSMGAEVADERERIIQITQAQQQVLSGLLASRRVLVNGVAGSGKTLLALEFAISLARQGNRVLFLCYNRYLSAWLAEQGSQRLSDDLPARDRLRISHFHAFALRLAKEAGVEVEDPGEAGTRFWEEEVPLILEQALDVLREAGRPEVYDAIVVDEAQDFSRDWWVSVQSLSKDGPEGRLYAFQDLKQSLRKAPEKPAASFQAEFDLKTNCRNTQAIARSATSLAKIEFISYPGAPEGQAPLLRRSQTREAERGLVIRELSDLIERHSFKPTQVVLVGPTSLDRSGLTDLCPRHGIRLTSDLAVWRRGDGVLVTTARAFKGLEADLILIYGLSGFSELFTLTDLYVAWTRARHRLILYCHGEEARGEVEAALASCHAEQP